MEKCHYHSFVWRHKKQLSTAQDTKSQLRGWKSFCLCVPPPGMRQLLSYMWRKSCNSTLQRWKMSPTVLSWYLKIWQKSLGIYFWPVLHLLSYFVFSFLENTSFGKNLIQFHTFSHCDRIFSKCCCFATKIWKTFQTLTMLGLEVNGPV